MVTRSARPSKRAGRQGRKENFSAKGDGKETQRTADGAGKEKEHLASGLVGRDYIMPCQKSLGIVAVPDGQG